MTTTDLVFHAVLTRQAWIEQGVFGILRFSAAHEWYTAECPDLDNARGKSCIPPGLYALRRAHYNRGGYGVWEVFRVMDRTQIYIHIANLPSELAGCVAIGTERYGYQGKWGVGHSTNAFNQWMDATEAFDHGTLTIDHVHGRQ